MAVTINGTTGVSAVQDGVVTDNKLNLSANSAEVKEALNASGTAPIYACRAWVNFDGTGTVSIRASGNVSSITDNGTGDYTVNFATAMPDDDYAWSLSGQRDGTAASGQIMAKPAGETTTPTTIAFRFVSYSSTDSEADYPKLCVAIFR